MEFQRKFKSYNLVQCQTIMASGPTVSNHGLVAIGQLGRIRGLLEFDPKCHQFPRLTGLAKCLLLQQVHQFGWVSPPPAGAWSGWMLPSLRNMPVFGDFSDQDAANAGLGGGEV